MSFMGAVKKFIWGVFRIIIFDKFRRAALCFNNGKIQDTNAATFLPKTTR